MTHRTSRTFLNRLFAALLAVISVGCVNDSPSGSNSTSRVATDSTVIINADPGLIVAVRVGETAYLDGSGSSANTSDSLAYDWSFSSIPDASNTQLLNTDAVNPSFVADARGTYMIQLVVTAGGVSSQRAIAYVEASDEAIDGSHYTGDRVHIRYSAVCADCHDGRFYGICPDGQIREECIVAAKSPDHIATSNMCEACHTTFGFELALYTDHLEVLGNCSECHDGVKAVGRSNNHIPTLAECDDCHHTDSFLELELDGSFDHRGITSDCSGCHNGIVATGKDDDHIETSGDCSNCHITDNFQDVSFDHSAIIDGCFDCHNDVDEIGKGQAVNHPVTSDNCEVCHNTDTFDLGGTFNHDVIDEETQPCASCHDGNHLAAGARGIINTTFDHANVISSGVDCGACHNTDDFAIAYVDHTSAAVTDFRCDSCHNNDSPDSAIGKPSPNHLPTDADCDVCHTPGNFATGQFDHAPAVVDPVNCDSCHDDEITAGKPGSHIPTTDDCRVCHGTDTFRGATVDHSVIFGNCATCHNGNSATGKEDANPTHIPTVDDCSSCHVYDVTFTPSTFLSGVHTNIISNCQDCHGEYATDKPRRTHIPTQDDCSTCHVTSSFIGATFDHTGIDRGCEGCHNGRFTTDSNTIKGKSVDHIPTDQDCYLCHTVDAFSPSTFDHIGISGNCESCHDGSRDGTGALGKTSVGSGHPDTNADCGVCHTTADAPGTNAPSFSVYFVDHTDLINNCTTAGCHHPGTDEGIYAASSDHGPTNGNDCEICHVAGGTWAPAVFDHSNITRSTRCDSCHNGTDSIGMDAKTNPDHIPTTDDCRDCHNTTTFAGATFDHRGINDNCSTCHNGDTATGKPSNHVPTNDDCNVCHQTTGFIPATFNHNGIVDNCQSCHDGVLATGKRDAVNHVSTNQDCGVCHNTTGFSPATFDHTGINNDCTRSGCHGDGATGQDRDHLTTNLDCSNCHTTATFAGGTWFHDSSTANNCLSCHSPGNGATPQPNQGHFDTGGNVQCDACHTTNTWADQGTFDHCPNSNSNNNRCGDYPGDHRAGKTSCTDCHRNNAANPVSYPNQNRYAPDCAGCHAGDFEREGDHIGGNNGTIEQNKDCGGSGCHRVNANGF